MNFEAVFLDLPEHFEPFLANGIIPTADLGNSQDLKACEPILKFCWEKGISVYCYLDTKASKERNDVQVEIARLVLRSKIAKKIDLKEWKKIIFRDIFLRDSSCEYIEMKVRENLKEENACLNLPLKVELALERDFKVERIVVYDFKRPIDRLYEIALRELSGEDVSDERWLEIIRRHISFVDTVVEVGYEDACKFVWI